MNHKEDRAFVRQFSGVIAAFVVLTIVLIFVARAMQPEAEDGESMLAARVEQRLAPVGAVRAGEAGAEALAETQKKLRAFQYGWWEFDRKMLGYVRSYGKGRVFHEAFGHDRKAILTPNVAKIILRGCEWAATGQVR